jgi:nitroreductase
MFDFLTLAGKRQSCRDFTGDPVPHDALVQCLEAARLAPSACNSQPWSFVAIESPGKVAEAAKCGQFVVPNPSLTKAGAFIVLVEEHAKLMPAVTARYHSQVFAAGDIGGAAVSICLAAESLGIGSCMIGIYDRAELAKLCGIPEDKNIFLLIALGIPASSELRPKKRKSFEEVARFI